MKRSALTLLAATITLASLSARADIITTSDIFATMLPVPVSVDGLFPVDAMSVSDAVSLDLFDAGLGTLTGVDVELTSGFTGEIDVSGTADFPGPFGALATGDASFELSFDVVAGGFSVGTGILTSSCGGDFDGFDPFTGICSSTDPYGGTFDRMAAIGAPDIGAFVGSGTFGMSLLLGPVGVDVLDPIGNFNLLFGDPVAGIDASWTGTVSVTYTFTPAMTVPEPGTSLLFGAGVIALGASRRRRQRKG